MSSSLSITPARKSIAPLMAFVLLLQGAVFLQNNVGTRQVLLLIEFARDDQRGMDILLGHVAAGVRFSNRVHAFLHPEASDA